MIHNPVLTKEVLQYLNPKPNENFIDGTIGQAGHAIEILQHNKPNGIVLGIDWDASQIENARRQTASFEKRILLVNGSYANIQDVVERMHFQPVNGILLDLGMSSWQLEQSQRGFSFQKNEALDMRYNLQNTLTAETIVNEYSQEKIEEILNGFGEEKFASNIARGIVHERKVKRIQSTGELISVIEKSIPNKFLHQNIHFATRTFQALRIAVNGELSNLEEFFKKALLVLAPQGRLVIISFHSLEDRIVKNFFRDKAKEKIINIITKKPIVADREEVMQNPRSRSAKLRAIIKL